MFVSIHTYYYVYVYIMIINFSSVDNIYCLIKMTNLYFSMR